MLEIKEAIIKILNNYNDYNVEINEKTDLFTDIGIDSLSLLMLLNEIETTFKISFDIHEIANCSNFGNLTKMIENKLKGNFK